MNWPKEVKHLDRMHKDFHKLWKDKGEPHPSSNDYLVLNRAFYYMEGIKRGHKMTKQEFEEMMK